MNLGKILTIIILAVLIIVTVTITIKDAFKPTFNTDDYEVVTIVIQSGDTLTDYYIRYAKEGTDRTEYIEAVKRLNHLSSSMIYAGDLIKIYKLK